MLDAETGKEAVKLEEIEDPSTVYQLRFTPDEKRIVAAMSRSVHVWDAASGKHVRHFDFSDENCVVTHLSVAPDGKEFVANAGSSTVRRCDLVTGRVLAPAAGPDGEVTAVAIGRDGRDVITVGRDSIARAWSSENGRLLRSFRIENPSMVPVVLSDAGRRAASAGPNSSAVIWDASEGMVLHTFGAERAGNGPRDLSPDGRYFAAGGDQVDVWDAVTGKFVQAFTSVGPGFVTNIQFSPDARMLATAAAYSGQVEVWSLPRGKRNWVTPNHKTDYTWIAFSPDSRDLATCDGNGQLRIFELASGKIVVDQKLSDLATAMAFSPTGRLLACGSGGQAFPRPGVFLMDLATGKLLPELSSDLGGIVSLAFTPDGRHLYGGCTDSTTLCWRLPQPPGLAAPAADAIPGLVVKLLGDDARAAREAYRALTQVPEPAVAELRRRLARRVAPDAERIRRLLAELDDGKYDTRAEAARQLAALGHGVEADLHKARAGAATANLRREFDRLLDALAGPVSHPDTLATVRAIAMLEQIASLATAEILRDLAKGDGEMTVPREAAAALARLRPTKDGPR